MYTAQQTAEKIKSHAKSKNILIKDMLEECELSKNALSSMLSRGSWLQANNLARIADYLDCSIDYLMGRTDTPEVNHFSKIIPNATLIPHRILAYYGKIAAAGQSVEFSAMLSGTVECPLTDESERADYTIGVSGDSMEPKFKDGDIVFVQKDTYPSIGDVGIFQKDNGIYIKEVGNGELLSFNKRYKPLVDDGNILCLGKVIGKLEKDD